MDTNDRTRFALLRGGVAVTLAGAALLAACTAELPTASDIEQMDAAGATHAARSLALVGPDSATVYTVDGQAATRAEADAIDRSAIASIEVLKHPNGPSTIAITTKKTADVEATVMARDGGLRKRVAVKDGETITGHAESTLGTAHPLVLVDGVKRANDVLHTLDPKQIQGIEVLKGAAATKKYSDPQAANGVILITMKHTGG